MKEDKYVDWIIEQVCDEGYEQMADRRYLFDALDREPFIPACRMDENRAEDGVDLRHRYFLETGEESGHGLRRCTMLEMLAALAMRCEETIMIDMDVGRRVGRWFFPMLVNMASPLEDGIFGSPYTVMMGCRRLRNHDYAPDGRGGLFYIPGYKGDMRGLEIWSQLMAYLVYLRHQHVDG